MERRKFVRVAAECTVHLKAVEAVDRQGMCNMFVRNLSRGGVEVFSFDFFRVHGKVYLHFVSARNVPLLEVMGTVVWVRQVPYQDKYRIGVKFTGVAVDSAGLGDGELDECTMERLLESVSVL